MVVTVSHAGYIKRVPLSTYRAQRRGGRGRAGMAIREEDFLSEVFVASTLAPVLFFTSLGPGLQAQGLPPAARHAAGARPADGQPAAAGAGRDDLDRHAAARGRGELGRSDRDVRHRQRLCPAQRAVRFRRCPRQRQDRDEVRGRGCRRPADRGRDLHRRRRRAARHPQRQGDPLPGQSTMWRRRVFTGRSSVGVRGIRLLRRRSGHLDVDPAPRGGRPGDPQRLSEARHRAPAPERRGGRGERRRRAAVEPEEADGEAARRRSRRSSSPISRRARNSC